MLCSGHCRFRLRNGLGLPNTDFACCVRRDYTVAYRRSLVETDLSGSNRRPDFLVHLRFYRGNVYCGSSDRGHGTHHNVWQLADPPLRRHQLWNGNGGNGRGRTGNESAQQRADGRSDDFRTWKHSTRAADHPARLHRSHDLWMRLGSELNDGWLLGDGSMATDLATAKCGCIRARLLQGWRGRDTADVARWSLDYLVPSVGKREQKKICVYCVVWTAPTQNR